MSFLSKFCVKVKNPPFLNNLPYGLMPPFLEKIFISILVAKLEEVNPPFVKVGEVRIMGNINYYKKQRTIMYIFCGNNAIYLANISFMFIFLLTPFNSRDSYFCKLKLSLVLLMKGYRTKKYVMCSVVYQTWRNNRAWRIENLGARFFMYANTGLQTHCAHSQFHALELPVCARLYADCVYHCVHMYFT